MGSESDRNAVVSEADLDWTECDEGDRTFRRKQCGAAASGEDLGTSLYEVPPGKRTRLAHYSRF